MPLSSYLRYEQGATGTKVVCAEGDCGACTVLLGKRMGEEIEYKPVNSCILFMHQLDCSHIVTVEGVKPGEELNPVQQAMVDHHGAQCGYCTPGIIVSMCSLFDCKKAADEQDIKDALTGNLCRCTGYEPIIAAGMNVDAQRISSLHELYPASEMLKEFTSCSRDSVRLNGLEKTCFVPASVEEAIEFKAKNSGTVIVSGGSDVCVNMNKRRFDPSVVMSLSNIHGLSDIKIENGNLVVGARATLQALADWAREEMPELHKIMWLFGSPQIRNSGTLAGNIANGSPIADTLPWLFVMEALIELTGVNGKRTTNINSFYKGYKKLDMTPDEMITRVLIPLPASDELIRLFKVSRRQNLDISTFTAAIRMRIVGGTIEKASLAYGGVGPVVLRLPKTELFLVGKKALRETFEQAGKLAREEIAPISDVRGSRDFRFELAENILVKFFHESACERDSFCKPSDNGSATTKNKTGSSISNAGKQIANESEQSSSVIGKNIPHDSARGHVTGASIYIDDMPPAKNELVVDFFASPVAHGKLRKLDLSEAAKVPGVVGLYTYKDLGGVNKFGPAIQDEVLLVEELCEFIGHPIVVIAAENAQAAAQAKKRIKVEIEVFPAVLTIDEAKAKNNFIGPKRRLLTGNLEKGFAEAAHVLEGTFYSAGQDHFYLESQACIVYPGEDNQLVVHTSNQNPTEAQDVIAHVLGLKQNQVVAITKRMGGGFGGKECQATHPAAMAALVALKTKRPARIIYDKDTDMHATGKRHPFQNNFKVGFKADGTITALKIDLFSDGGAACDLSLAVLGKALLHADNAYYVPNTEVNGTICKTNLPPNTAFRGFGSPQAVANMENIIEEVAAYLKKDSLDIRLKNIYGIESRNTTPYGQQVTNNTLPRILSDLEKSSEYRSRMEGVKAFNASSKTHLKGLAFTPVKFGVSFGQKHMNQASALVNIYLDGTIQVSTGATEMGQGVNTNMRQLVAGEFDLDVDSVIVMPTSTEKNNNASPTAASSATDLNGAAAVNACEKIRERLSVSASNYFSSQNAKLKADPQQIIYRQGWVFDSRDPDNRLSFKALVKRAYMDKVSLGERGFHAHQGLHFDWESGPEKVGFGVPYLYFTNGASVAEVLIDRFTGDVRVERVDILMDIGKSINPGINRGQITGAFIQGMGWVTTEDLKYSEKGELLSHSPTTYKIPNIQDTPAIFNVDCIENNENTVNVKGSKAVGEPPFLLAVSVWAAIKHALSFISNGSVPKLRLPATNEEILTRITQYQKRPDTVDEQLKQPALLP